MILGVGIDVVDVDRFRSTLARTPGMLTRLFAEPERALPMASLAARFAAKEALVKALGAARGLRWQEVVVTRAGDGRPRLELTGATLEVARELGVARLHLSLSHEGGLATAVVVAEE